MQTQRQPRKWVKMQLSAHWQNKLLMILSSHGIFESYPEDHIIYMNEKSFTQLLFSIKSARINVTLKQLKAEYVDMNKEPRITVIRSYTGSYQKYQKP